MRMHRELPGITQGGEEDCEEIRCAILRIATAVMKAFVQDPIMKPG